MEHVKRRYIEGDFRGDFTRVLLQQGRVLLDADFNEQVAILLHSIETLATDLIGPHAGPVDNCGFEIISRQGGPPGNLPEDEKRRLRERLDSLARGDFL